MISALSGSADERSPLLDRAQGKYLDDLGHLRAAYSCAVHLKAILRRHVAIILARFTALPPTPTTVGSRPGAPRTNQAIHLRRRASKSVGGRRIALQKALVQPHAPMGTLTHPIIRSRSRLRSPSIRRRHPQPPAARAQVQSAVERDRCERRRHSSSPRLSHIHAKLNPGAPQELVAVGPLPAERRLPRRGFARRPDSRAASICSRSA